MSVDKITDIIVLGSSPTALYVAREASKCGAKAALADFDRGCAFGSRYASAKQVLEIGEFDRWLDSFPGPEKSGLIIPKSNGSIQVTGRMFGNGIYFSDQSTKSLNYSYGYWDGGAKDNRCFMFLADVAMGKPWHPTRTGPNVVPAAGHDSVYARGGRDIVQNNEMIVYRTSQAKLKYLVEFQQ